MSWHIDFNKTKNALLKETRGVDFDQLLQEGKLLDNLRHKNLKKYPHQRVLVIQWNNYVYAIPYVKDLKTKTIFLKTLYPSRVLTKKYLTKKEVK